MSELILYTTEDGTTKVSVQLEDETVWLTQKQMVELYQTAKSTISEHIKNIYAEEELMPEATVRKIRTVQKEGSREVTRELDYYNLDMIIALGYRINSKIATRFRQWATSRLKEYIVKGFTMDDERLKNLGGGTYWKELLDRIRDIRSSEKVMYRQILDLYATATDYDPKSDASLTFFKIVQNKLHYAATDIENETEIGLLVGEHLLPYPNVDLVKYISEEKKLEYYWLLLGNTYGIKAAPVVQKDSVIKEFTDLNKDVELNQLLSYLKNNFYICDKVLIKEKFLKFFNEVVILENLDFLTEYQFLLSPEMAQETTLGIYSTEKKGDSYNLLHWINHKTINKLDHFRKTVPTEKAKKIIYSLKPAICYYFLHKYFEDVIESILEENKYSYLANHKFFDKGAETEIDFFVNTGKKLYYIESKTKLTKFYIEDFLKKSSSMINKLTPMTSRGIEVEFILIGGYSDGTVSDYQYFIQNSEKHEDGYNTERAELNGKPYYFTVPIPDKQGKQITCIAEPQYENLQSLILQLCQK